MYAIEHYLTANKAADPYMEWLHSMRDITAKISVVRRNAGRTGNEGQTMKLSRPHDQAMSELYRNDPDFAATVINTILNDGDQGELLVVLRQIAKAFGGVSAIAQQANLNPTQLYRTLSQNGNPALSSLLAILKAMNLRLHVEPMHEPTTR